MKTRAKYILVFAGLTLCGFVLSGSAQVTNAVGTSGFAYTFSTATGTNPALTLNRGTTYLFQLNVTVLHPFFIKTDISAGSTNAYNDGVTGNGGTSGNLIFTVPADAPNQLFYNCANHSITFGMHGTLNIVNPPTPPSGEIVLISISPDLVTMQSLGGTGWSAIPEFSSNFNAWASVPNYTNVLANGTNTTTFDRLDAICGPNVFLRVRNQQN